MTYWNIVILFVATFATNTVLLSSVNSAHHFNKQLAHRVFHHKQHRRRRNTILLFCIHPKISENNFILSPRIICTMRSFPEESSSPDPIGIGPSDITTTLSSRKTNDVQVVDSRLFWDREYGTKADPCDLSLPIIRHAKIICLSNPMDRNNQLLYNASILPTGCEIIHIGCHDIDYEKIRADGGNVIFVSDGMNAKEPLQRLIQELGDQLQWIHSRSAGIDSFYSDTLSSFQGTMSNAKGQFSSTLAEYTIASCLYFAKDFPKLLHQKQNRLWNP
jgi:hypothetical protein